MAGKNISVNETEWYKDAIIYELHVRAFCDGNGDGIGDFKGLTSKLDYLQDLGINAVWLLPFFPSPLRDDGYDIADYCRVHPDYGTLRDFKNFVKASHARGIRVIAELVLNHTSSEHPWFQRARRAKKNSRFRNFYVWSETPERYEDARIIFKDFEQSNWAWDAVAHAYYWHRFYSHQPDLNYENPEVRKAIFKVIDFWFDMGVDGLRLDAVPYLFEEEGTNCENLPQTHTVLKELRSHVDAHYKNKMLLAEANQWPEDAVDYFGSGDECHMAYHFPLMPRLFMAVQMEDSYPIIDIIRSTPKIPDACQWAIFLRNHDELTLEMVTDEERDYMNRTYAQDPRMRINQGIRRRLAPLLDNNRRKIELMKILLFSFPGTPIIYYGDEIGMGDNFYLGDRNGVRTPMQWSTGKNAGFSDANPQRLYSPPIIDPLYHYEMINVENQQENLSSLLWWMKWAINMRKQFMCFSRGDIQFVSCDNAKVLAFIRSYKDEHMLVVANLSQYMQVASLDLRKYSGRIPQEVESRNNLPPIRKHPYTITFSPYGHYWFNLLKVRRRVTDKRKRPLKFRIAGPLQNLLKGKAYENLEKTILPEYLKSCRWFASKTRTIRRIAIDEYIVANDFCISILAVQYQEGEDERYFLPLAFAEKAEGERIQEEFPQAVICPVSVDKKYGILYDALCNEHLQKKILNTILNKGRLKGKHGDIVGIRGKKLNGLLGSTTELSSRMLKTEQSNTSVKFENTLYMKFYRKLDNGTNPELEIIHFLTEKTGFSYIPQFGGAVEYRSRGAEPVSICLLQGFVENRGDAWSYTLDIVKHYFERVLAQKPVLPENESGMALSIPAADVPQVVKDLIGGVYLEMAEFMGKRTAEMHQALGSMPDFPGFGVEPFSVLYQRSVFQSMQSLCNRVIQTLRNNLNSLDQSIHEDAAIVLSSERTILELMRRITKKKISAYKIRIHGDYHLGQLLYTGKDIIITDFEGEPARLLSERKLLYSALKDVAGMVRSFHYAAYAVLFLSTHFRPEDLQILEEWIRPWHEYVAGVFLDSYFDAMNNSSIVPQDPEDRTKLLHAFLVEKSLYELGYELNNRPSWTAIPLRGILSILEKNI